MFKNTLKKKIQNNFIVFLVYNFLNQIKNNFKFNFIYKFKYNYHYIDKAKILEILKNRKKKKNSHICHIIGGGESTNISKSKISKKDFVLGCNLSALLNLKFDFYSVEFASFIKSEEPKFTVLDLVKGKLLKQKTIIIFKNILSHEIDRNFLNDNYLGKINFIKEYSWRCFNDKQLEFYVKRCLINKQKNFYQYNSTLVFLISLAYQIGFKKIVLHGLDFGGDYFFTNKIGYMSNKIKSFNELKKYQNKNISRNGIYLNHRQLNMPKIFKLICKSLNKKGVQLYAASRDSKSSKFLRVFNTFK